MSKRSETSGFVNGIFPPEMICVSPLRGAIDLRAFTQNEHDEITRCASILPVNVSTDHDKGCSANRWVTSQDLNVPLAPIQDKRDVCSGSAGAGGLVRANALHNDEISIVHRKVGYVMIMPIKMVKKMVQVLEIHSKFITMMVLVLGVQQATWILINVNDFMRYAKLFNTR